MMTGDGLRIADDMMLFSGSQDRYNWKMKGKKLYTFHIMSTEQLTQQLG